MYTHSQWVGGVEVSLGECERGGRDWYTAAPQQHTPSPHAIKTWWYATPPTDRQIDNDKACTRMHHGCRSSSPFSAVSPPLDSTAAALPFLLGSCKRLSRRALILPSSPDTTTNAPENPPTCTCTCVLAAAAPVVALDTVKGPRLRSRASLRDRVRGSD